MLSSTHLALVAGLATAFIGSANAHGYVYQPAPTWSGGSPNGGWIAGIDYYWEEVGNGGDQVGKFKELAAEKGMSVRDVLLEMDPSKPCGNTLEDGTRQDVPSDGLVQFSGTQGGGFTHQGPCEIWFDDTLALRGDNCENEYPGGVPGSTDYSKIPVDYSLCKGDCVLRFYWLGFQNAMWQSYINCIPLKGSSSSVSNEATSAPSTEAPETEAPETEAPETEAPETESPETEAPATTAPATEAPETESPETEAPADEADDETEAPAATAAETPKPSCKARERRLRN